MHEDDAQLRMRQAPHVLAMLKNTAWGRLAGNGTSTLAHARREVRYPFDQALHALASYRGFPRMQQPWHTFLGLRPCGGNGISRGIPHRR